MAALQEFYKEKEDEDRKMEAAKTGGVGAEEVQVQEDWVCVPVQLCLLLHMYCKSGC